VLNAGIHQFANEPGYTARGAEVIDTYLRTPERYQAQWFASALNQTASLLGLVRTLRAAAAATGRPPPCVVWKANNENAGFTRGANHLELLNRLLIPHLIDAGVGVIDPSAATLGGSAAPHPDGPPHDPFHMFELFPAYVFLPFVAGLERLCARSAPRGGLPALTADGAGGSSSPPLPFSLLAAQGRLIERNTINGLAVVTPLPWLPAIRVCTSSAGLRATEQRTPFRACVLTRHECARAGKLWRSCIASGGQAGGSNTATRKSPPIGWPSEWVASPLRTSEGVWRTPNVSIRTLRK